MYYYYYIYAAVSPTSSPPSSSSHPSLLPSTSVLFLFIKGQASQEFPLNTEYEAAVRLGTFHLAIKAGKDNSVWEVESQKPVKD